MTHSITIAIAGCSGRMGLTLVRQVMQTAGATLAAGSALEVAQAQEVLRAENLAEIDLQIVTDTSALVGAADAIIDFTSPDYSLAIAQEAAKQKKTHVCGTTGFSDAQLQQLENAAQHTPIIWAPNFAMGVNLVAAMVEKVAATLDPSFDIEIVEMHHRRKVDAPSGTALLMGEAAAKGREVSLAEKAVRVRDGVTGAREEGTIGFATLRGGDVIGDHTTIFAGEGERIELTHKSSSRQIYARGAVQAALWAQGKAPGLYNMQDVLGL